MNSNQIDIQNNQSYTTPSNSPMNNSGHNDKNNSNNGFMNILPLILGITSIVSLFINAYLGIILGIAAIVTSIKIKNKHSKKGKITGIVGIILCFLYILGTVSLDLFDFNMSDKELNGKWFCIEPNNLANITSDNTSNIWSEATFNSGKYTLQLGKSKVNGQIVGGTTKSGKYTMKPSTINKDAWEKVKVNLSRIWDLSDKLPKPFALSTDDGSMTAIKIYTVESEILMLYTDNESYVCWQTGSKEDPTKDNNINNNSANSSSNKIKGNYSREIFSESKFEYKTSYDTATFTFNSDSTFVVSYIGGETYRGDFEIYNGLYISIKADKIAEDTSIQNGASIATDIKNVSNKMMDTTEAILNTYLIWLKTDSGILQPFLLKYNPDTNSGTAVNILGQVQGTFTKK